LSHDTFKLKFLIKTPQVLTGKIKGKVCPKEIVVLKRDNILVIVRIASILIDYLLFFVALKNFPPRPKMKIDLFDVPQPTRHFCPDLISFFFFFLFVCLFLSFSELNWGGIPGKVKLLRLLVVSAR
jgi:hypothetical protein